MATPALVFMEDDVNEPKGGRAPDDSKSRLIPSEQPRFKEKIKVVGIGGGGNNAIDHIIRSGANRIEFLAINTDAHCLEKCLSVEKLVIGEKLTKGHGAGARPEIGEQAAMESRENIRSCLRGCDMVYLAAGMGGGTGTGALPVVAEIAKEMGILTVAVVTRPFGFEGKRRTVSSNYGIEKTKKIVDALIVVPNDRLLLSERSTTVQEAFAMADGVLRQAVQGVTDLVTKPGLINVDFADLRSIMKHSGGAVMGVGKGKGDNRAGDALRNAMESPLMESSMKGAKGVILNVTAGPDIGIFEVQEAADQLREQIDPDANFIWGFVCDETMGRESQEEIQMVVIATGFDMGFGADAVVDGTLSADFSHAKRQPPRASASEQDGMFTMDSPLDTPSIIRRGRLRYK
ncbi:MAG: cell division protein FtsZ [Synergistaceae bacterium]|nr:cell division protein FtsZ [Synergistaceae bacterium]